MRVHKESYCARLIMSPLFLFCAAPRASPPKFVSPECLICHSALNNWLVKYGRRAGTPSPPVNKRSAAVEAPEGCVLQRPSLANRRRPSFVDKPKPSDLECRFFLTWSNSIPLLIAPFRNRSIPKPHSLKFHIAAKLNAGARLLSDSCDSWSDYCQVLHQK